MARLYSRYPGGAVGLGLLLLRLAAAAWIGHSGMAVGLSGSEPDASLVAFPLGAALLAAAWLLALGLHASLAASLGAACLVVAEWQARLLQSAVGPVEGWFYTGCLTFVVASLAVLGPGGYSLDAHLSGWRTINLPSRHDSSRR
jgi:hypothetical protein